MFKLMRSAIAIILTLILSNSAFAEDSKWLFGVGAIVGSPNDGYQATNSDVIRADVSNGLYGAPARSTDYTGFELFLINQKYPDWVFSIGMATAEGRYNLQRVSFTGGPIAWVDYNFTVDDTYAGVTYSLGHTSNAWYYDVSFALGTTSSTTTFLSASQGSGSGNTQSGTSQRIGFGIGKSYGNFSIRFAIDVYTWEDALRATVTDELSGLPNQTHDVTADINSTLGSAQLIYWF